jgi:hypothetical protein
VGDDVSGCWGEEGRKKGRGEREGGGGGRMYTKFVTKSFGKEKETKEQKTTRAFANGAPPFRGRTFPTCPAVVLPMGRECVCAREPSLCVVGMGRPSVYGGVAHN